MTAGRADERGRGEGAGLAGDALSASGERKGEGADCLGLVRGIWRETMGAEPEATPAYQPDWAQVGGEETLLDGARRWLVEKPVEDMRPGDVLFFRMAEGAAVKHCAILSEIDGPEPRMVHAYWGRAVVESWMGPWWKRRLAAVFAWPSRLGLDGEDTAHRPG